MIQIFTTDGTDDIVVVERSSGVDVAAPWSTGQAEAQDPRLAGAPVPSERFPG